MSSRREVIIAVVIAMPMAFTCVTCGQKSDGDAGVDAAVDVGAERSEDAAPDAFDAAEARVCLGAGSHCTDPSVCCRTVCDFIVGDEFGTCQ